MAEVVMEKRYNELLARVRYAEDRLSDNEQRLVATVEELSTRLDAHERLLAELRYQNERLAVEYNKAIEVINDLSERVTALESNYDPTVIK